MKKELDLHAEVHLKVPFSDIDAIGLLWHGNYVRYMEYAREEFGRRYGMPYSAYRDNGYVVPVVEMQMRYKQPVRYEDEVTMHIRYIPSSAAKIEYEYLLTRDADGVEMFSAKTVQLFVDTAGNQELYCPVFFKEWQDKMFHEG